MIFSDMTRDERAELKDGLRFIAGHYGITHQMSKLLEECGELLTAQMKTTQAFIEGKSLSDLFDNQHDEFADVGVVWVQVFMLMPKEQRKRVLNTMLTKVRRQLQRIEQETSQEVQETTQETQE